MVTRAMATAVHVSLRVMVGGWLFVWGHLAVLGMPLVVVGVILLLCERAWDKRVGAMGSLYLVGVGLALCVPLLLYLARMLAE